VSHVRFQVASNLKNPEGGKREEDTVGGKEEALFRRPFVVLGCRRILDLCGSCYVPYRDTMNPRTYGGSRIPGCDTCRIAPGLCKVSWQPTWQTTGDACPVRKE